MGLSVDEIFGNLLTVNFTGHASTANTFAFSILLLVASPGMQDWLAEEIGQAFFAGDSEDWDYNKAFPALKHCQAVLLETLRLYPPILALPKWTNNQPQCPRTGDREISILPNMGSCPVFSLQCKHTLNTGQTRWYGNLLDGSPRPWKSRKHRALTITL